MNGQFKTENFDKEYFKEFAAELEQAGIPITTTWKKGTKKVEETNEKVNMFSLEIEGKWFFRIIKNKGHVRFEKLNPEQEKMVLEILKKYHFYNDPNWGLGIGLAILYLIIEVLVGLTRSESFLGTIIFVCCALVILFLWIAYEYSRENVTKGVYKVSMVFGIIGYIFTAIGSLLAIPLLTAISQNHLKAKILKAE